MFWFWIFKFKCRLINKVILNELIIENNIDFKSKGKYMDNVDIIKLYRVIYMLYKIISNFFKYCVRFLKLDWLVSW